MALFYLFLFSNLPTYQTAQRIFTRYAWLKRCADLCNDVPFYGFVDIALDFHGRSHSPKPQFSAVIFHFRKIISVQFNFSSDTIFSFQLLFQLQE